MAACAAGNEALPMEREQKELNQHPSVSSLFDAARFPSPADEELLEVLAHGHNSRVERIVSTGQTTPEGQWYDQEQDEWVALLSGNAELTWKDGEKTKLKAGDWLLIPAHARHRVTYTSTEPPCVWLAFFFNDEQG